MASGTYGPPLSSRALCSFGDPVGHIPELVADSPPHEQLPQLKDITDSTGIKFDHLSSPEQKYIVESMSGSVALIDFDCDGWPDIYFTKR